MSTNHAPVAPATAAAIYVRRSSRQDLGKNHSLREQEKDCRALAASRGLTIVAVYAEREGTGASTYSNKARPQWNLALQNLDEGKTFETLLVWSLDRADRRGADTLAAILTKHAATGRRILTVDGTDTSDEQQRLVTIIRGEIAREEAATLAKRITRTKAARRKAGTWLGGKPPYGLKIVDGKLAHDPATYPTARRIAELLLNGMTPWGVSQILNNEGVLTWTGKQWRAPAIHAMMRTPGWAGLQSTPRRTGPEGKGWAFVGDLYIDPETREPVVNGEGVITPTERSVLLAINATRAKENERNKAVGNKPTRTLCGGLLRCASCGCKANSATGSPNPKTGRRTESYTCAGRASGLTCESAFTIPRRDTNAFVGERFLAHLAAMEPDDDRLLNIAERWTAHRDPTAGAERAAAQMTLDALDADLARARRLAVTGVLTEEEAAEELGRLRALRSTAIAALADMPTGAIDVSPLLDMVQSREAWEDLALDDQRALLPMAIDHIVAYRARKRGVRFVPEERLRIVWID